MALDQNDLPHSHKHNTIDGWKSFEHTHPSPDPENPKDLNRWRAHEHSNGRHSHPHGHHEYVKDLPDA